MREIGIGMVGAGFISQLHAEAFTYVPEAHVRGVAARSAASAARFAEQHGIPTHHTTTDACSSDPAVDVLTVALPNHLHREVVLAAAAAGKHVICEKPLAPDARGGRRDDRRLPRRRACC